MKKFCVLANGRNFLIRTDDNVAAKHGFYQHVNLEAATPQQAESIATERVRTDESLRSIVLNSTEDPPEIHIEEVNEVAEFPGPASVSTGRAWYSEDELSDESPSMLNKMMRFFQWPKIFLSKSPCLRGKKTRDANRP